MSERLKAAKAALKLAEAEVEAARRAVDGYKTYSPDGERLVSQLGSTPHGVLAFALWRFGQEYKYDSQLLVKQLNRGLDGKPFEL